MVLVLLVLVCVFCIPSYRKKSDGDHLAGPMSWRSEKDRRDGVRTGQWHPVAHKKYGIPKTASRAELKLFRDGSYLDCPPDSLHTPGIGGQINVATDPRDANVKDYTSGNGFGDIKLKKDVKAGEELLVGSYHWGKPVEQAKESRAWWNQTPKPARGILWDLVCADKDPGKWRYNWVHPSPIPEGCKKFEGMVADRTPEKNLPVLPYVRRATQEEYNKKQEQREKRETQRQKSPGKTPTGTRKSKRIHQIAIMAEQEEDDDGQPDPAAKDKGKPLVKSRSKKVGMRGVGRERERERESKRKGGQGESRIEREREAETQIERGKERRGERE